MTSILVLVGLALVGVTTTAPVHDDTAVDMHAVRAMLNAQLYQGDMMLPRRLAQHKDSWHLRNAAVSRDYYLWPNGVIPYVINQDFDENVVSTIKRMMKQFETYTCIRFKEKTDQDEEFLNIFKGVGCYGSVGRDPDNPKALVSLGEGCYHQGTVAHELMHVVGYYHEHSRSDRDDYLVVHEENIKPEFKDEFIKLDKRNERILTPFDYSSIMLYGPLAFSKDDTSKTMEPKLPNFSMIEVYQKPGLTSMDAEGINLLYKNICKK